MFAVFVPDNVLPEHLRSHFVELQNFVGDIDGKTIAIPVDENTFIDDGTVDTEDAVKAINSLVEAISHLHAALVQCAAPFDTGPTTLAMAPHITSTEFQRRMNIAAYALNIQKCEDGA